MKPFDAQSRGSLVDLSHDQLRAAVQRVATEVKLLDALQLVAALGEGCKTFPTNDHPCAATWAGVVQLGSYAT